MKKYVCGFMFSPNGQTVVLILKKKPDWQRDRLNGIGGSIEAGETPVEAMVREFKEETGVKTSLGDWQEVVCYTNPGIYQVHFFRAFHEDIWLVETTAPDEGDVGLYRAIPLPRNVIFNLNWLVALCLDDCVSPQPIQIVEGQLSVKPGV